MSSERASKTIDLIEPCLRAAFSASTSRPFVVGISGPQGSGKSTVSAGLQTRLEATGLNVALLSIDDLYLPREARERLAETVHPMLRTRGVPGTHDIALGEAVIDACGRSGCIALPRFSKQDDTRRPEAQWARIEGPIDILLFEGWCVGAAAQAGAALIEPVNALEREEDEAAIWRRWVNDRLASDYRRLFGRIDWQTLLAAPGFGVVSAWRREQEHSLRAALVAEGRDLAATLDDAGVDRFIQYYQRITEHMLAEMRPRSDLVVELDVERRATIAKRGRSAR